MAVTHGFDRARRLNDTFAETVVVYGVGPLGMCHVIKARLMGAGKLIAIDRFPPGCSAPRSSAPTNYSMRPRLEPDELLARVREQSGGRGADIVLDCSGVPETFVTSLRMMRVGGTVVEAGAFVDMGPVEINPNADICSRNVAVLGIGGEMAESYVPAMELLTRNLDRLPLEKLRDSIASRSRRQRRGVELAQRDEAMKVVLSPAREM